MANDQTGNGQREGGSKPIEPAKQLPMQPVLDVTGAIILPVPAVTPIAPASRKLADLPRAELEELAGEFGLEASAHSSAQLLVSAIHQRRQAIAGMDRQAMLDVMRWGRRPIAENATKEQLAHEIAAIRSMRFEGLSERGLLVLARMRNIDLKGDEDVPAIVKKLKKKEGFFARMNRKRRAFIGSIVSNMMGETQAGEYQDAAPQEKGGAVPPIPPGARGASIKDEIEESGLFGGIASRVKKTADQYINQKLDEIESRIDRKLDEIDRRLAEWRDKEIAYRIRILKITLWASVIVAALSLVYTYVKVNFWQPGNEKAPTTQQSSLK